MRRHARQPCSGGSRRTAGQQIDIIQWSPDPATFIVNGLAPAEVTKVVLDEEQQKIEVVVPDEQLSLAIGRRGQNVTGLPTDPMGIMILTEEEESERRQEEFNSRSQMFMDGLDVDDVLAHLLVTEGFSSIEEVAYVPIEDLLSIEGFDEEIAEELRNRANIFLSEEEERLTEQRRNLGVADDVAAIDGLTPRMLVTLGEAGIKTLDDLGDLATDELMDPGNREGEGRGILADHGLDEDQANAIIMAARAHWFDDEGEVAAAEPAEELAESVEEN